MKLRIHTRCAAALALAVLLSSAPGCSKPGSTSPAATTTPPDRPQVTAAPAKAAAPGVERYQGYYLRIKPARGPEITLKEPVAAQLIMDSLQVERLQVKEKVGTFRARVDILGPDGKVQYAFTVSSDGQTLIRYKDGRVFRMPEYVYYLIEESLWTYDGTLVETPLKWQPEKGNTQLELVLPRLIKTSLLPAFGYAPAYFCSYKIYAVNTETRDKAKVYMLITYAGYDFEGNTFSPTFQYTTPATLIFTSTGTDTWRLAGFKQPPETKEDRNLYTDIRTIFPYECMEEVMADIKSKRSDNETEVKGVEAQVKDIVQQATEYLNTVGLSGFTVVS